MGSNGDNVILLFMPWRGREWMADRFITSIAHMIDFAEHWSGDHLRIIPQLFIDGDLSDDVVRQFEERLAGVSRLPFRVHRAEKAPGTAATRPWDEAMYDHMVDVRNWGLSKALELYAHMVWIDSDIMAPSNTIWRLWKLGLPMVGALVRNHPSALAFNAMMYDEHSGRFHRDPAAAGWRGSIEGLGIIEVGLTGACCFVNRDVIFSGARFHRDKQGEDAGFCRHVRRNGFKIYCDTDAPTVHWYTPMTPLETNNALSVMAAQLSDRFMQPASEPATQHDRKDDG